MSGFELTSPIAPLDWTEEEEAVCTSHDHFNKVVKFGDYYCHPWDTVTTLLGRSAFWNPHMAAVLSGPVPVRRAIHDQGATVKELERNDAE